mgnify:CR=1 FL=1
MSESQAFERKQRLRLRFPAHDRELAVDVTAVNEDSLWIMLAEPALWMEDHHVESGVELSFWRDGARHVAEDVEVLAYDLDRGRIHVAQPETTRVAQRRRTFRETVELPVHIRAVDGRAAEETVTQDLGGGGLCVSATQDLSLGIDDEVQVELQLPERFVSARGRIRWAVPTAGGRVKLGLAFTRIGEREQDWVYGFLFNLQRSRLRAS